MTSLALALSLAAQSPLPASAAQPWRVYTSSTLHVGVRPAAYIGVAAGGLREVGVGVTVQVSR